MIIVVIMLVYVLISILVYIRYYDLVLIGVLFDIINFALDLFQTFHNL